MKHATFTIITGASMGIGKAFALECAERGMNLLLVALPDTLLEEVQRELEAAFSVTVLIFPSDLTKPESVKSLYQFCLDKELSVQMLINNVGMGAGGRFENIPLEKYLQIMDLNNKVMVSMCHYFIPLLQQQSSAFVLNMSSMEATLPLPYKAVYTGSKHFVYAFSLALREELKRSAVSVSVICPGPVLTNPDALKRVNAHGKRAKWVISSPAQVAKMGVNGVLKGKAVIVPGSINQVLVRMMKVVPTFLKMKMLERLFRVYSEH